MIAVEVSAEDNFTTGDRTELFSTFGYRTGADNGNQWSVTPDGQRFVMSRNFDEAATGGLVIVENFFQVLKTPEGN